MSTVFSYSECRALVEDFARAVPVLLSRHPQTADLALELEKLQLTSILSEHFSVAVVGQMRVGKSTLLNALIGRDLAPTGVTETTATVNWFRQDPGGLSEVFRVHDDQGGEQDFPLSDIKEWLGVGERARHTRRLDFFTDSPFLQTANLIDTPGLRSVIDTHQDATTSFLEEKYENDTLAQTGRADAVIYALNPVARETDSDMLDLFGAKTRLPGSAVWNSLAVVQKWEHLDPDPLEEVAKKCARLAKQLESKVATVIPTSGLLARLAATATELTWERIARLGTASEDTLTDILESPEFFTDDIPGVPLSAVERGELRQTVPWPALRLAVKYTQSRGWRTATDVQRGIQAASGIDNLKALLERRFFTLSSLIKVGSALRKAWTPCQVAMLRLRQLEHEHQRTLELGHRAMAFLHQYKHEAALADTIAYVDRSLSAVESESVLATEIQIRLDSALRLAEVSFSVLESDVNALDLLDCLDDTRIDRNGREALRRLFGVYGPEPCFRLGYPADGASDAEMLDAAEDRLAEYQKRYTMLRGDLRLVFEAACQRLGQIANHLHELAERAGQ